MTDLEKNIIVDYPLIGAKECSLKYNISYNKVLWIREKFNLFILKETKSKMQKKIALKFWKNRKTIHAVNENIFINKITKESSYLLGFIWGDGYISTTGRNNVIRIECVSEDINILKPVFEKTGNWNYYVRKRIEKKREVTTALTSNKELVHFLIQNDYENKSIKTPQKIWNLIPNNLKKYFILGWIDADGCFYWNEKHKLRQFYISGSFEQDWSVFENLLNILDVKYRIIRVNGKTRYSHIRVTGKININKIGNYIYNDLIPFQRKYDKYRLIIN